MRKGDKVVTKTGYKAEIVWCFSQVGIAQVVFEDLTSRLIKLKNIMHLETAYHDEALKHWDRMNRGVATDLFSFIEGFIIGVGIKKELK